MTKKTLIKLTNKLFALACVISAGVFSTSVLTSCSNIIAAVLPAKNLGESRTKPAESLDIAQIPQDLLKNFQALRKGRLDSHHAEIIGLFLLPESNAELAIDSQGTAALWEGGDPHAHTVLTLENGLTCAAFNAKTGRIALAGTNAVTILAPPKYQEKYRWPGLKTRVSSCDFAPNGTSLLVGGNDGMIYRWRFGESNGGETEEEQSKLFEKYIGHPTIVSHVLFHNFGRVFFLIGLGRCSERLA